jgi:hypothetical protein
MPRILLAAALGGIAMFVWGAVSHMLTPLGEAGLTSMPAAAEPAVLESLRSNLSADGLYFFPGMDEAARNDEAAMKEWEQRYAAGPSGLLVYHPHGGPSMTGRQLGIELLGDVLAVAVAAWAATRMRSYAGRLALVTAFGLAAWFSIEVSYWNWYGFPSAYAMAQLIDQVVGFAAAGLVVAWIVRPVEAA